MKLLFLASLIVLFTSFASAQQHYVDSLHNQVNNAKEDTTKVLALFGLAEYYGFNQFDSSFFYARQTIELSEKIKYTYGSSLGLRGLFYAYNCQGNYPKALEVTLQNFKIAEKIKSERPLNFWVVIYMIGVLNREMGNFPIAINQFHEAIQVNKAAELPEANIFPAYIQLALVYQKLKKPDSALWFAQKGYDLSLQSIWWSRYLTLASAVLGEIHNELGQHELARKYFSLGVQQSKMVNNTFFSQEIITTLLIFLIKQVTRIPVFITPGFHFNYARSTSLVNTPCMPVHYSQKFTNHRINRIAQSNT